MNLRCPSIPFYGILSYSISFASVLNLPPRVSSSSIAKGLRSSKCHKRGDVTDKNATRKILRMKSKGWSRRLVVAVEGPSSLLLLSCFFRSSSGSRSFYIPVDPSLPGPFDPGACTSSPAVPDRVLRFPQLRDSLFKIARSDLPYDFFPVTAISPSAGFRLLDYLTIIKKSFYFEKKSLISS